MAEVARRERRKREVVLVEGMVAALRWWVLFVMKEGLELKEGLLGEPYAVAEV